MTSARCARRASGRADEDPATSRRRSCACACGASAGVLEDIDAPPTIQRRIVRSLAQVPYAPIRVGPTSRARCMNYVQERQTRFPGVTVEQVYLRQYPRTTLAAQLLGHRRRDPAQAARGGSTSAASSRAPSWARAASSTQYDRYLRGTDGSREIQVDAPRQPEGRAARRWRRRPGQRLKLSLDLGAAARGRRRRSPRRATRAGSRRLRGDEPRNGEILAMGSYPSFDPNLLDKPITQERYDALFGEQAGSPLFNRATERPVSDRARRSRPSRRSRRWRAARSRRPRTSTTPAASRSATASSATPRASPTARSTCSRRSRSPPTSTSTSLGQNLDASEGPDASRSTPASSGFGRDTGIDLPAEADGRRARPRVAQARRRGGAEVPQEAQGPPLLRPSSGIARPGTRATTSTSPSARATCRPRRCSSPSPTRRWRPTGASRAARRPGGRERVRRAHPAHRARAGPRASRSTRAPARSS